MANKQAFNNDTNINYVFLQRFRQSSYGALFLTEAPIDLPNQKMYRNLNWQIHFNNNI